MKLISGRKGIPESWAQQLKPHSSQDICLFWKRQLNKAFLRLTSLRKQKSRFYSQSRRKSPSKSPLFQPVSQNKDKSETQVLTKNEAEFWIILILVWIQGICKFQSPALLPEEAKVNLWRHTILSRVFNYLTFFDIFKFHEGQLDWEQISKWWQQEILSK